MHVCFVCMQVCCVCCVCLCVCVFMCVVDSAGRKGFPSSFSCRDRVLVRSRRKWFKVESEPNTLAGGREAEEAPPRERREKERRADKSHHDCPF